MSAGPLDGVRVTVLRVAGGSDAFAAALRELGATATTLTVGDVVDRSDAEVLEDVGVLERFAWVVVTSVNAARRLELWSASWPHEVRVAAVGATTAAALEDAGVPCTATSRDGTALGLAASIERGPVLFLAARGARRELVEALGNRGIEVVMAVAYETVLRELDGPALDDLTAADVIVATSPSGIDAVRASRRGAELLLHSSVVAIGPTTAEHARELGVRVVGTAERRDATSVVAAVRQFMGR